MPGHIHNYFGFCESWFHILGPFYTLYNVVFRRHLGIKLVSAVYLLISKLSLDMQVQVACVENFLKLVVRVFCLIQYCNVSWLTTAGV